MLDKRLTVNSASVSLPIASSSCDDLLGLASAGMLGISDEVERGRTCVGARDNRFASWLSPAPSLALAGKRPRTRRGRPHVPIGGGWHCSSPQRGETGECEVKRLPACLFLCTVCDTAWTSPNTELGSSTERTDRAAYTSSRLIRPFRRSRFVPPAGLPTLSSACRSRPPARSSSARACSTDQP